MTMMLPDALQNPDDSGAMDLLHSYYGDAGYTSPYGGAAFDA